MEEKRAVIQEPGEPVIPPPSSFSAMIRYAIKHLASSPRAADIPYCMFIRLR